MKNINFGTCDPYSSDADREERRAATLEQGGIFIDVYPTHIKFSIGHDADEKLTEEARTRGVTVEKLMEEILHDHLRRDGLM